MKANPMAARKASSVSVRGSSSFGGVDGIVVVVVGGASVVGGVVVVAEGSCGERLSWS